MLSLKNLARKGLSSGRHGHDLLSAAIWLDHQPSSKSMDE